MPSVSATARSLLPRGLTATFLPWTGVVLLSLLWFMAVTLLVRRLAGAFEMPLTPFSLLVVGAMSSTLAAAARLSWPVALPSLRTTDRRMWQVAVQRALPTAALILLGLALSLPETLIVGLLALWTFLLLEELWAWLPLQARFFRAASLRPRSGNAIIREAASGDFARGGMEGSADGVVMQKTVRTVLADGLELMRGQMRIPFVPGQRIAAAHVAFCPPFDQTPQVEFRQTSGPGARVKLAQVYPYGSRFDLKLATVAPDSTSVVLDFSITGKSVTIL